MPSKRSKVHPKYKTKYRVKYWAAYARALGARGDITLWITPQALEAWRPAPTGGRGAQPRFSDLAIETALTLCRATRHDILQLLTENSPPAQDSATPRPALADSTSYPTLGRCQPAA